MLNEFRLEPERIWIPFTTEGDPLLQPSWKHKPEHGLLVAILHSAIEELQKGAESHDRRKFRLAQEAAQWVLSEERAWPFAFAPICDRLSLDVGYVRRGLAQHLTLATQPRSLGLGEAA